MAAEDHVSQNQFMPITQLMKAHSGDFSDWNDAGEDRPTSVGDVFNHYYSDRRHGSHGYKWDDFRKSVGERGIQEPLKILKDLRGTHLVNGHHRAMMAIEQGHLFVPYEDVHDEGDYWDNYRPRPKSQRYQTWD